MTALRWAFFWPVTLISLCLVVLCILTAVSLFNQQTAVAGILRENVASRRIAVELEECLTDLVALEMDRVNSVTVLHARIQIHLDTMRQLSDEPMEWQMYERISTGYAEYLRRWQSLPPPADVHHALAFRETARFLESQVLRPCTELRLYQGRRLEDVTERHERILSRLAWGMAGIGVLAGVAGLVLGFGVARILSRSIRRLQVQIRSATGKLGIDLPEIVLTRDGRLGSLHEDINELTNRIEVVVQQLQQREREVLRAEQLAAVGQLAAGVGHEIRNPLTSIKMLVQAALEDPTASLTPAELRIIEAEVRRMEVSLRTFLDFARHPKPERRRVILESVIDSVMDLIRGRAERQKVICRVESPEGGTPVVADPAQIRQVLLNLVLNALDAMPTGGTLAITAQSYPDRIEIEVADTGPGVPGEVIPKLFQPFVSSKETGLGLGLVISRRIAEDHGGTLDVFNRPGGASARMTLPAGDADSGS